MKPQIDAILAERNRSPTSSSRTPHWCRLRRRREEGRRAGLQRGGSAAERAGAEQVDAAVDKLRTDTTTVLLALKQVTN
ncbi:MAG: hypothetical protein U0W40_13750 [Acidimicrobiia bacterium]